jgi:hypothetical protein
MARNATLSHEWSLIAKNWGKIARKWGSIVKNWMRCRCLWSERGSVRNEGEHLHLKLMWFLGSWSLPCSRPLLPSRCLVCVRLKKVHGT